MLTIRLASSADQTAWDQYLARHPQALLGHQFAFYQLIPQVFGFEPYYWLAEENQQIVGIAPFILRTHLVLGKRLTSLPYLNTGGLLSDSPEIGAQLWQTISAWASEHRIKSVELRNRFQVLADVEARQGRSVTFTRLPADEDSAWKMISGNVRNHVKKSQALELQEGFETLPAFWQAYAENMFFLGAPVLPLRWFTALANTPPLNPHLISVLHQGQVVGGMFLFGVGDLRENGWVASQIEARGFYANERLYWEAIRWGVQNGIKTLDWGRSEAGGGHERFKEKFGGESAPLPYQELKPSPQGWAATTEEPAGLYQRFRNNWKRLPRSLAARLGPYFSRQVY